MKTEKSEAEIDRLLSDVESRLAVPDPKEASPSPEDNRMRAIIRTAVEEMMLYGVTEKAIVRRIRTETTKDDDGTVHYRFALSDGNPPRAGYIRRLIKRARERWQKEREESRAELKAMHESRLLASMQRMHRESAWSPYVAAARQLAELQGTLDPLRVEVDLVAEQRRAIEVAIGYVSDEQLDQLSNIATRLLAESGIATPQLPQGEEDGEEQQQD